MAGTDEFALIRRLTGHNQPTSQLRSMGVHVGIGDDAAVVETTPAFHTVLSCDTLVEGVHFLPTTMTSYDIGYKAMASNISDMAAMGAIPRYALVCLTVPATVVLTDLDRLYAGLYACAKAYAVTVVGGDTTSTPGGLVLSVTIVGEVEAGRALLRSTAQAGDIVFITGCLGRSAAGLDYLLQSNTVIEDLPPIPAYMQGLLHAHQQPQPQVAAGRLLLESGVCHALNDISDGLASEAWEIAEASGCGIVLVEADIPIDEEMQSYAHLRGRSALDWILYGGEDYQLVGTLPAALFAMVKQAFKDRGLPFYRIGQVRPDFIGVRMLHSDGSEQPLAKEGYNHFR